jgi:hypothetical protein
MSVLLNVIRILTFTVVSFHLPVRNPVSSFCIPERICGISAGVGGANSTLAYFKNRLNLGVAKSTKPAIKSPHKSTYNYFTLNC